MSGSEEKNLLVESIKAETEDQAEHMILFKGKYIFYFAIFQIFLLKDVFFIYYFLFTNLSYLSL